MSTVLPFEGFLDVLRAKGYAVGLPEHFGLARLIERWDHADRREFRDALAALLARDADEVDEIRRLFDVVYPVEAPEPPPPPPPVSRRLHLGPWAWLFGLILAAAIAGFAYWRRPVTVIEQPPPPVVETPAVPANVPPPAVMPLPAPPTVPDPPRVADRRAAAAMFGSAFLIASCLLWRARARVARRASLRAAWRKSLANLPGPYHPWPAVPVLTDSIPRADIEDAAVILGRAYSPELRSRELDVKRTIQATLRFVLPVLVFKVRRLTSTIVVLEDIGQDMAMWRSKTAAFLERLRRQGIPLERWYFDGDLRYVAARRFGMTAAVDMVLRRRSDAPVLVVGSGSGLAATLGAASREWLDALRRVRRRSWLTPVDDRRLWPDEMGELQTNVWPMTRHGLAEAARDLAGFDARDQVRMTWRAPGTTVSQDDIERIKRLASLVPNPTVELLNFLRRKFAPDVSDSAIVHLLAETAAGGGPVVRLTESELRRCVEEVRFETPGLERAVRTTLLEILQNSKPPAGSAAYLRWQSAVAIQEVALADLNKTDATRSLATLRELSTTPIWEEVRQAAARLPASAAAKVAQNEGRALDRPDPLAPPRNPADPGAGDVWPWPGWRELMVGSIGGLAVLSLAWLLHLVPASIVNHVQDAYTLNVAPGPGGGATLSLATARAEVPTVVDLYKGEAVAERNLQLATGGSPSAVDLVGAETGAYYQVRATLPAGNLALSRAVWVPSSSLTIVLVNALPWANVSITPSAGGPSIPAQATPFSVALEPGAYRLHFENGLQSAMDQDLIVRTAAAGSFQREQYVMPGFDPEQAAKSLTGRPPGRQ